MKDLTILVEHPFKSYKVGKPSLIYAAPRDYQPTSMPVLPLPPKAEFIRANPRSGSEVDVNAPIQLTFSHEVDSVAGATGFGKHWTIQATQSLLDITWQNKDRSAGGPKTLHYSIVFPPPADTTPPRITGGNVTHGAKNVRPGPLNADRIEITFNEEVKGSIELRLEDNTLLEWHGLVSGKQAVLRPVAGNELKHATTYVIIIKVSDDAGNRAEFKVEFTTRLKVANRW